MNRLMNFAVAALLVCLALAQPAWAQPLPSNIPSIRADMSGNWFNPEQSGHGIQLEVLDNGRVVLAWYTFDRNGNPLWLFGVGQPNLLTVEVDLLQFTGGRPPAFWDEAEVTSEPWGSLVMEFDTCDAGTLSWTSEDPDFPSGEMPIERLTKLQGLRCLAEEQFSQQLIFSFERRMQGFTSVFADLPANWDQPTYQLDFRREPVPPPINDFHGLRLTGHNSSDDLIMLAKAPVHGLLPGAIYRVEMDVDIATNVPYGCSGVGGSPGESVYVKLGAAGIEPIASVDPVDNWLRLNIDIGDQSEDGAHARVAGNVANSQPCEGSGVADWELKTLTTQGQTMLITTSNQGVLWVFAGTDSAFEGLSQYYILALRVRLEPFEPETP